jgi:hypothetical protein
MAWKISFLLQVTLSYLAISGTKVSGATFSPVLPPSYPLAVRNPYLSGLFSRYIYASVCGDLIPVQHGFRETRSEIWQLLHLNSGKDKISLGACSLE